MICDRDLQLTKLQLINVNAYIILMQFYTINIWLHKAQFHHFVKCDITHLDKKTPEL